jgi:hypothetical protein
MYVIYVIALIKIKLNFFEITFVIKILFLFNLYLSYHKLVVVVGLCRLFNQIFICCFLLVYFDCLMYCFFEWVLEMDRINF